MKPKTKFIVFWALAIFAALLFEVFFADFRAYRWWNVLENLLFAFGMLLSLVFFNSKKIKTILANTYFVVFVFVLFLESAFFYLFDANFSASTIFIFMETNTDEAMEFLGFYLNGPIIAYLLLLSTLAFFFLKIPKGALFSRCSGRKKFFSGVLLASLLATMKFTGLIDPNLPYLVGISVYDYFQEQQKMAHIHIDEPEGNFKNVEQRVNSDKSLYVLVIGESTTRDHLGIYGYYRHTTPKLMEIKDELLIYQNVISPHAFTIGALKEALTLHGFEKEKESSVVQLMNQAGFKTYWISNQRPIGRYESLVTEISKASDVVRFTNMEIDGWFTPYDAVLLPYFEKALADPADKKFIVLHILGTHVQYKNRYPEKFNFFQDRPKSSFEDELAYSRINAYDNAVRYMDYFLRKVIEKVREQDLPSYVLYFSDHGEEVYEDRYFAGHMEANPTKSMFEVPFFLWRSKKFRMKNSLYFGNTGKPYELDDFIHSLADLSQIYFTGMKEKKSIFSKEFVPKKRTVGTGIDFDVYFKK